MLQKLQTPYGLKAHGIPIVSQVTSYIFQGVPLSKDAFKQKLIAVALFEIDFLPSFMITRVSTRCNDPTTIYCNYEKYMWIIVDHHGATSDRFLPNVRLIFFGSGRNTPKMENKNMQDFCRSLKPTFFPPEILARAQFSESSSIPTIENLREASWDCFR